MVASIMSLGAPCGLNDVVALSWNSRSDDAWSMREFGIGRHGGSIGYLDLSRLVEACIALDWPAGVRDLRDVLEMDRAAREASMDLVKEFR